MVSVMRMLRDELSARIDLYSEAIMTAHLDLLLSYAQRFYGRQFMTRKPVNQDVLVRLETVLTTCFARDQTQLQGLPTVSYLASELNYSDSYLSDLLKTYTGQTAQQHIHRYVIEKAKELLTQTNLTISEIAFQLGFDFPQSFSRLFESKTNINPLRYRQSFN